MDVEDARTIGARLRQIRNSRKKGLRVIAGLAGMSKSKLSQIERGERALDSRSDIVALANALQIAPSELTKTPEPLLTSGDAANEIRRVLQAVIAGAPDGQVQTAEQLSARVHAMGDLRQRCAYREMGEALPGLIADLHASVGQATTMLVFFTWRYWCTSWARKRICTSCAHRMTYGWSRHHWPTTPRNASTIR